MASGGACGGAGDDELEFVLDFQNDKDLDQDFFGHNDGLGEKPGFGLAVSLSDDDDDEDEDEEGDEILPPMSSAYVEFPGSAESRAGRPHVPARVVHCSRCGVVGHTRRSCDSEDIKPLLLKFKVSRVFVVCAKFCVIAVAKRASETGFAWMA